MAVRGGPDLNDVYKLLGTLSAQVNDLRDDVKEIKEDNDEAASHREKLRQQVGVVIAKQGEMEETLVEVKGVTDKVTMWEERGVGALFMVGIGASAITWALTYWFDSLATILGRKL